MLKLAAMTIHVTHGTSVHKKVAVAGEVPIAGQAKQKPALPKLIGWEEARQSPHHLDQHHLPQDQHRLHQLPLHL